MTGELMAQLFTTSFKSHFLPRARAIIEKEKGEERQEECFHGKTMLIFDKRIITDKMKYSLVTGNWSTNLVG